MPELDEYRISELDPIATLDNNDLIEVSHQSSSSESGYVSGKAPLTQVANKIVNNIQYVTELQTESKTIVGAINEVAQGGGGTTDYDDLENKPQINSVELSGNKSLDDLGIQPSEISKSASGSIATFTDGGDNIPVKSFECEIVAQQASGTPTPANPLPITGFSQADITVTDNDQVTNLYTVSFGQTIYGGRLIYSNGQWAIEADKAMNLISDLSWNYDSTNIRFNTTDLRGIVKNAESNTEQLEGLSCECYVVDVSSSSRQIDLSVAVNTSGVMVMKDTNYTDVTSLISAVGNYKIVYPLATPVIIPITSSTRVKTISGANNIFSNTGDVELEYFTENADEIAELVEAEIASKSADYHEYSTDEQIVGKWIDNSDIYEKTYHLTGLSYPNNAWTNNILGTSNINIVDWDGYFVIDPNNTRYPIKAFFRSNTVYASTNIDVALNDLNFFNNMGFTVVEVLVILRYIKTSSNTRSLNLSKGIEETEETAEIKTEEIKEAEK